MQTGQAHVSLPSSLKVRLRALRQALSPLATEAYLVGGAVRDAILQRPILDIDIIVSGDLPAVAKRLAHSLGATLVPLDPARGVFRLSSQEPGAVIDLKPLAGTLIDDLLQRDFTIDAMAVPLAKAAEEEQAETPITDPTGGLNDLRRGVLRAVADNVFRNDGARLLRGVRLASELGFRIDPATITLMRRDAGALRTVSNERIRDELCRALATPNGARYLRVMDRLGLFTLVFPELDAARGSTQPKEHYYDVFDHTIEAVAKVEEVLRQRPGNPIVLSKVPWDPTLEAHFREEIAGGRTRALVLKLGALLHDVAKPVTKTIEPNGRIRFFGHPKTGAEMAEAIMQRLQFSIRERRMVVNLVREHLRPGLISREPGGATRRAIYRYFRDAGDVGIDTLFLSFADFWAARGPLLEAEEWNRYATGIRGILETRESKPGEVPPPKLIDGHVLMRELALPPGAHIGRLLERVHEAHAIGEVTTREQALALAKRVLREERAETGERSR